jgi:hypothetical protein
LRPSSPKAAGGLEGKTMVHLRYALLLALTLTLSLAGCPEDGDDDDDVIGDDDDATADDDDATADDDDTVALEQLDPQRIFDDVAYLASDELGGRAPGTEGNEAALQYVESVFEEYGLEPMGDEGGYRQGFTLEQWQQLAPSVLILGGTELTEGSDFVVFSNSGSGDVTAEMVFVGYGLTVPAFDPAAYPDCPFAADGYDDYADVDVTGKIALLMRHGPHDDEAYADECPGNEASVSPGDAWTFGYKAANASLHGAAAVILVGDYNHGASPVEGYIGGDYFVAQMPMMSPRRTLVEEQVAELEAWYDQIEATDQPYSQATGATATVTLEAELVEVHTANVHGVIPGTDPALADEVVIYGAHIDHVGTDAEGTVYNGADDNASGSAVMLEMARMMAAGGVEPARTVLFSAYNAEELGLIGSCHYVDEPIYPLEDTVAMLSIDMVGAGDASGLIFFGGTYEPHSWLSDLAAAATDAAGLDLVIAPMDPSYNSDHGCFAFAGIPAMLALTLGPHGYYHTPEDTIENILEEDLGAAAAILWETLKPLATGTEDQFDATRIDSGGEVPGALAPAALDRHR